MDNWTFGCTISIIIVRQCVGNIIMILYILSVGQGPTEGGEMMDKISVKVYFTGEGSDGTKRNFSRTVNYVNGDASEGDLAEFKTAFSQILGKQIAKAEKITVISL